MNHWTRLPLLGALCALVLLFACMGTASAVVLSPTNSPLPGSNFQGGDGNQANPVGDVGGGTPLGTLDGVTDIDWQKLGQAAGGFVANGGTKLTDNNLFDTTFEGGDKETEPYHWFINSPAGAVTPDKAN